MAVYRRLEYWNSKVVPEGFLANRDAPFEREGLHTWNLRNCSFWNISMEFEWPKDDENKLNAMEFEII